MGKTCGVEGCDKPFLAKDMCTMHYNRVRRGGGIQGVHPKIPAIDRFLRLSDRTRDCWNWLGHRNHGGYGCFQWNGHFRKAHRFAYEYYVGPIPEGMTIDHLCNNPGCVNPSHMEVVDLVENSKRRWQRLPTRSRGAPSAPHVEVQNVDERYIQEEVSYSC